MSQRQRPDPPGPDDFAAALGYHPSDHDWRARNGRNEFAHVTVTFTAGE